MPGHRIRSFAVEAEQAEQAVFQGAVPVGSIGEGIKSRSIESVQYRALLIGGEQGGFNGAILALSLRQKLGVLLENRTLYRTLYLARQAAFQIKALDTGLGRWRAIGQAIQWVVTVETERRFTIRQHRLSPDGLFSLRRHPCGLQPLGPFLHFKGNGLSFFQRFITLAGYRREMNEQLLASRAARDKAIALCIVEPFNGSLNSVAHFYCPACPNE
jgi:hypothetical protein